MNTTHPAMTEAPRRVTHGPAGHYVPDGWADLGRGLCPCGEALRWTGEGDELGEWLPDRSLRVLVLTAAEADALCDIVNVPAQHADLESPECDAACKVLIQLVLQDDLTDAAA